jgi:hydroxyacylglutathione hydrolase
MRIEPIACLSDNYGYLVVCEETNAAAIVDASEVDPIERAVVEAGVKLVAIWSTHHHHDHVGGNEEIAKRFGVDVYAHVSDRGRVPAQTRFLETGAEFAMGSLRIETIHIPGHTLGAIAYVVSERSGAGPRSVFTGDTMFIAGCGRLFEGTPAQMHDSLTRLAALGDETRVYCGHEYTVQNLRFAAHVEPSNPDIAKAASRADSLRAANKPTVFSTMAEEKRTNPFLRTSRPEVRRSVGADVTASDVDAFAAVRRAKDSYR